MAKNIKMNFRDLIYQVDSLECAVWVENSFLSYKRSWKIE